MIVESFHRQGRSSPATKTDIAPGNAYCHRDEHGAGGYDAHRNAHATLRGVGHAPQIVSAQNKIEKKKY
jgi:hypothetical protein